MITQQAEYVFLKPFCCCCCFLRSKWINHLLDKYGITKVTRNLNYFFHRVWRLQKWNKRRIAKMEFSDTKSFKKDPFILYNIWNQIHKITICGYVYTLISMYNVAIIKLTTLRMLCSAMSLKEWSQFLKEVLTKWGTKDSTEKK